MRSTALAKYAHTLDHIERWSELSTRESRIRREHAHVKVRTVLGISGFGVAMFLMLVWAMAPTP